MKIKTHILNQQKIAEVLSGEMLLGTVDSGLDLLGDLYFQGYEKVIVYEENIAPEFFDLRTGMAGEILQKFAQYRMPLIIIGNFSKYNSNSLQAFIRESNRGKSVNFMSSLPEVLNDT